MGKENKNPIPSELKTIWHPSKNNHLDFHSIQLGTGKIVWWLGGCGHEWKAEPRKVALGTRCPYCSGLKIREGFNDIVTLNPSLAQEIHPTKNDNLNKNTLSPGSHKKIWWLGNCGHEWKSKVKGRHEKKIWVSLLFRSLYTCRF